MEFRPVTIDDAKLLFEWANDETVRANSFHSEPIEWEKHLEWLTGKTTQTNALLLLFFNKSDYTGIVRIEPFEDPVIGITVAPGQRGNGYASCMLKLACARFHEINDKPVTAYIKTDNIASIRAFEKAGFVKERISSVNACDCVVMIKYKY